MNRFKTTYFFIGLCSGVAISALAFYIWEDQKKVVKPKSEIAATEPAPVKTVPQNTISSKIVSEKKQAPSVEKDTQEVKSIVPSDTATILVKKDILLLVRDVKPVREKTDSESTYVDTLEESMNIRHHKFDLYRIEVWQSPLGYEGYRITGNKISLYGLDTVYNFALTEMNEELVLTAGSRQFLIKRVNGFSPLTEYN